MPTESESQVGRDVRLTLIDRERERERERERARGSRKRREVRAQAGLSGDNER